MAPSTPGGLVGPRPEAYMVMMAPASAGWSGELTVPFRVGNQGEDGGGSGDHGYDVTGFEGAPVRGGL